MRTQGNANLHISLIKLSI